MTRRWLLTASIQPFGENRGRITAVAPISSGKGEAKPQRVIHRGRGDDDIVIVQAIPGSGPVSERRIFAGLAGVIGFRIAGWSQGHGQQGNRLRVGAMAASRYDDSLWSSSLK